MPGSGRDGNIGVAIRDWLRRDWLALLIFTTLSLVAIYPVLPDISSLVVGFLGDNVLYTYTTGWVGKSLTVGESPFVDPHLNYPGVLHLAATDVPYLNMLLVAPFTLLFGPVFSYNLLIITANFLSGYFTYLWILKVTGSRFAGLVSGVAFLLTPFRIVHSLGHLTLVSTQILPLLFWALENALSTPRPSLKQLMLLGGVTFLLGATSQYLLVLSLLVGAVYTVLRTLPRWRYLLLEAWKLVPAVATGAFISALPYLAAAGTGLFKPYDVVAETRIWSASVYDFLIPSRLHPLWGNLILERSHQYAWVEHSLYIGIIVGVLALIGLFRSVRTDKGVVSPHLKVVWLASALIAAIIAFGTDLHINMLPAQQDNPVWLPMYYLGNLPIINMLRVWARAGIITILFFVALSGLGACVLEMWLRRFGRWQSVGMALCVAAIIFEFLPGNLIASKLVPRPVDQWLAGQRGDFAVAFLPVFPAGFINHVNYIQQYGSLYHGKRVPAFQHDLHIPREYAAVRDLTSAFPSPESVESLRELGLRYLVVSRWAYNGQDFPPLDIVQGELLQNPSIHLVATFDDSLVFEYDQPLPPVQR
ncbi:MAG: hypothetical protein M3441_12860 [Chloroflexota bacterium]|nr:hypothetical protein [Chloroflexota bacterium]